MELRVLNYFLTVAREENITKAAQFLHISQPTLSRQLMQLEGELGVKLFQRSNHSIVLTEEGMLLKRRAKELVSLAEKTKQDLMQTETELSGEISIGCGELKSVDFLSKILTRFQKENPLMQLNLYSGNADSIKEQIESGVMDMGLLSEPVDVSRYAFLRMPQKEVWGLLVRKDSVLAEQRAVSPSDLIAENVLLSNRGLVKDWIRRWAGAAFDDINIVGRYNLLYNAAVMVRNKIGAAICIELDCCYEGTCFVPFSPRLENSSVLVWKKDQMMPPATAAFLCLVEKYIKGIPDDLM